MIFDGVEWHAIDHWTNEGGSFAWTSTGYDISAYAAGNLFKIGFLAYGEDSFTINGWAVDNIVIGLAGNLEGTVTNPNTNEVVEGAMVTVTNETKDIWTGNTDEFGQFLAPDLSPGSYDVFVSNYDYYPTLVEDVIVYPEVTTTIEIDLNPVAPVMTVAQYNDQQVSLEWVPIAEEPLDNISGSEIILHNDKYVPGETIDLDLSFFYNSEDFEFICGLSMDFPDGITVNASADIEGPPGSGSIRHLTAKQVMV